MRTTLADPRWPASSQTSFNPEIPDASVKLPKVHKKSFGVESQVEVFELLKIPMESSVDLMEQKVHDLDNRLKQMKEERDQVIQENEELQEQLDMTNTNNSVGKS